MSPPLKAPVRKTILIVEDEEMILSAVMTLLRENGYDCIPARDGAEALAAWDKYRERISAILLDVDLPKINGWEVLTRVRNSGGEVKIIICTGFVDPEKEAATVDGGADGFLGKPYEAQEVLDALDRVFVNHRPR